MAKLLERIETVFDENELIHIFKEIVIRLNNQHIIFVLEAVFIGIQATDKTEKLSVFVVGIGVNFCR